MVDVVGCMSRVNLVDVVGCVEGNLSTSLLGEFVDVVGCMLRVNLVDVFGCMPIVNLVDVVGCVLSVNLVDVVGCMLRVNFVDVVGCLYFTQVFRFAITPVPLCIPTTNRSEKSCCGKKSCNCNFVCDCKSQGLYEYERRRWVNINEVDG